jgi:DNA invertase Pin-like site-specific DNA recombinase
MPSALGYMRVSTDRQETARQRLLIEQYAQLYGLTLLAIVEEPDGVSGRSAAAKHSPRAALGYYAALAAGDMDAIERPGYRDLLDRVDRDHPDQVLAYALDRLARDAVELLLLERLLAARGVAIVSIAQGGAVDTATSSGWLQYAITAVLAEHECRQISDRTRATLAAKQAAGIRVGRPPVGWRVVDGAFIHDLQRWPKVELAHQLWQGGHPYEDIARRVGIARSRVKAYLDAFRWQPPPPPS